MERRSKNGSGNSTGALTSTTSWTPPACWYAPMYTPDQLQKKLEPMRKELRMLEQGVFRVGNDEYVESNGTYGVSTLLRSHVTVRRDRLEFCFLAKGKKERQVTLDDADLARAVSSPKRARTHSDRLLMYRTGRDWRPLDSQDVNERLHELVGDEFTVKDLRTWNGTVLAAVILAGRKGQGSKRTAVREMFKEVAHHLGNTPAIARKSYVDPRVVRAFEQDLTIRPSTDLERVERSVARLLGRIDFDS